MRTVTALHDYQRTAVNFIVQKKRCGLFLEMGLGKTVTTLTAISWLLAKGTIRKALIIAPLNVAKHTWAEECEEWQHLNHLRVSKVVGTAKQRRNALQVDADVYICTKDLCAWLVKETPHLEHTFDMIVIDELSAFKNHSSQRFKAMKSPCTKVPYFVGLTGTPSPNGYLDLWSQCYLIDGGKALFDKVTHYRNAYFTPLQSFGHIVYSWGLKAGAATAIEQKLQGLAMSMQAKDYLQLPSVVYRDIRVYLTDEEKARYKEFAKTKILELMDGNEVSASSAAVLSNMLQQYLSGAIYSDDGSVLESGVRSKIDKIEEVLDSTAEPVLVLYKYRHERERLLGMGKDMQPVTDATIKAWNDGRGTRLVGHPASMGHGLNLQKGGRIILWAGLTWSLEEWQQANARLYRQGQTKPVFIYRVVCVGTVEDKIVATLDRKGATQQAVMDAVKDVAKEVGITLKEKEE